MRAHVCFLTFNQTDTPLMVFVLFFTFHFTFVYPRAPPPFFSDFLLLLLCVIGRFSTALWCLTAGDLPIAEQTVSRAHTRRRGGVRVAAPARAQSPAAPLVWHQAPAHGQVRNKPTGQTGQVAVVVGLGS